MKWNKTHFGKVQQQISDAWKKLEEVQKLEPTEENLSTEANLCDHLQELLKREEIIWRQKSRVQWLTSFDLNTRSFHLSTIIKMRCNSIDFLKNENGEWLFGREEIGDCFCRFYQNLFTSSNSNIPQDLEGLIPFSLTEEDKSTIISPPSLEEIKGVIFSMGSHKAPRPDGMSTLFFKHYWHIIGSDVATAILSFFEGGYMLKRLNHTFINLIPMGDKAATMN